MSSYTWILKMCVMQISVYDIISEFLLVLSFQFHWSDLLVGWCVKWPWFCRGWRNRRCPVLQISLYCWMSFVFSTFHVMVCNMRAKRKLFYLLKSYVSVTLQFSPVQWLLKLKWLNWYNLVLSSFETAVIWMDYL